MKFNTNSDEKIGEFVGIFVGDGNYTRDRRYHHQIRVFCASKDTTYIKYVTSLFKFICNKKPNIYERKKYNETEVRIISKNLLLFLRKYLKWNKKKTETICLRKGVSFCNKKFLIGFLRGLLDTDGYIDKNRLVFSTISNDLARNIENSLRKLSINYRKYKQIDKRGNRKPISRIVVTNDFKKLVKTINPIHY